MELTFPYYTAQAFKRFFWPKEIITPFYLGVTESNAASEIHFNEHNFNQAFLVISANQKGEKYEVPSLIKHNEVIKSIVNHEAEYCVTPLSVISSQLRRTSESIFKYFFGIRRTTYLGLRKAVTNKGDVYYGAPGLILNSNFEPLIVGISEYCKGEGDDIFIKRNVLKVSPSVFTSKGLIEKAIINKLIPYYSSVPIESGTARIEVDDISKYIAKPIPPQENNVQQTLKRIMHLHKDEILKDFP